MRSKLGILVALMLAVAVARADDPRPTVKSVGDKVMCLCGCVAILNQCPHQGCSTHEEVQAVIQKMISEGKTEPEIFQALVARYGTQILAAPPAKGFNLTAWVLPSVGLVFGLVAVIIIVRRMRKSPAAPFTAEAPPVDPKLLEAIEEEMKTTGLGTRS